MKKDSIIIRTGIGRCSHRLLSPDSSKPLVIGGIIFDDMPGFQSNSDGDVAFYALSNAITTLTHVPIIGGIADELFAKEGTTDSEVYVKEALKTLKKQKISYVSLSFEGKRPRLVDAFPKMRQNIARVLHVQVENVGMTAITGDGLSDCGCGDGIDCLAIITTEELLA